MEKRKILIQIDSDPLASVFDRVVAIDAGVEELFSYAGIKPEQTQGIVHGAIFTRGPKDLKSTALFIGGSDVQAGERLLAEVQKHMIPAFGLRISVMMDSNGANTTAAAAVRAAGRHLNLKSAKALSSGAPGLSGNASSASWRAKGRRSASALASSRAESVCQEIRAKIPQAQLEPLGIATPDELHKALVGRDLVIAAGAAGVVLLPQSARDGCPTLKVAIDLNAVPPLGIEGVQATDKEVDQKGVIVYGALGVGSTKMKVHRAALAKLFERNDQILDAEEIYRIAQDF